MIATLASRRRGWLQRLWPLPALLGWLLCWAIWQLLQPHWGVVAAWLVASALGALLALGVDTPWRRAVLALGFPLLALAALPGLAGWVWLVPLGLLAVAYPWHTWRDAPMFPTPAGALDGLAASIALPAGASVLDAGCGLGHGLLALQRAWPDARVEGIEFSPMLALLARWRCRRARVRRGDMWAASWRAHQLVYLFQRPESMARAWRKACAEMPDGGWLVSLEFGVPGRRPDLRCALPSGRQVLAWRIAPQPCGQRADIPR